MYGHKFANSQSNLTILVPKCLSFNVKTLMKTKYKKYKFIKGSKGQKSMPQRSEQGFFPLYYFYVDIISSIPNLTKVEIDGIKNRSSNTIKHNMYSKIEV